MKAKLEALFAESPNKEAVVQALAELGYAPKLEQGTIVVTSGLVPSLAAALGITAEQLAGDLSKVDFKAAQAAAIKAAGDMARKETLAYVQSIHDICALGGMEKMAPALIAKEAKIEDARTEILAEKAKESQKTGIRSTIGGVGADGANPLVEAAKKDAANYATRK